MWRVPAIPIGAHTVLSLLAEPLKQQIEILLSIEDHDVSENLREFQDWSEYYSCDANYRSWLKIELENEEVLPSELSNEEKHRAVTVAREIIVSSLKLLSRKDNPWLVSTRGQFYESVEPVYIEMHVRQFYVYPVVNASISTRDNYCIEVILRCLPVEGDGLGAHDLNNGGILAAVLADGFKGNRLPVSTTERNIVSRIPFTECEC